MRVISGKLKGLKLVSPEGIKIRPTTDRLKETLFNIIQFDIRDCIFLDLCAGTGSMGIEALSRYSKYAIFIEKNSDAVKTIEKNLEKAKLQDSAEIFQVDARDGLKLLLKENKKMDIIFIDPPYALKLYIPLVEFIIKNKMLKDNGYIIVERLTEDDSYWYKKIDIDVELIKSKRYRLTTFDFIR